MVITPTIAIKDNTPIIHNGLLPDKYIETFTDIILTYVKLAINSKILFAVFNLLKKNAIVDMLISILFFYILYNTLSHIYISNK